MSMTRGKLVRRLKRMSKPAQTVSELYMDFLRKQEESSTVTISDPAHFDRLRVAAQNSHQIVERLALFGAALNSNFVAIEKKLNRLGETNPDLLRQIDEHIGGLVGLRKAFLQFYGDEAIFCEKFEQMVRTRILVEAGIDPNDNEAAMAYLIKTGKAQAAAIPNPSSN